MSQYDFGTIDAATKSGSGLATDLNSWRDALHSAHKGGSEPSYKVAGMQWIDDSTSPWVIKLYDGTDWVETGYIDPTNNIWTPAKAVTGYRVIGADCKNNAGTPNTQFDLDADVIVLADSSGMTHAVYAPGAAITNNISTAGPTAHGRDQVGAFSAGSWVHFYWIWNGATLATLSSATAPPTGPTLPVGYTHWAYAGAVYLNSGGALEAARIKGSKVYYDAQHAAVVGGTGISETTVSLSALVPPNALDVILQLRSIQMTSNGSGNITATLNLRTVTAVSLIQYAYKLTGLGATAQQGLGAANILIPNVSQQFYYAWLITDGSAPAITIDVIGYTVPNGG